MLTHHNLVANILQSACALEHRRARHHAGRAAVLSHLRHGGDHEPRSAHRRDHRDDAAIRPGAVPADHAAVPSDVRQRRSADRARRSPRHPLVDKYDLRHLRTLVLGRCPARRARGGGRQAPAWAAGSSRVTGSPRRHRYPRHAHRPHCRTGTARIKTAGIGPPVAEHRSQGRRRDHRRGAGTEAGRRDLRARSAGDEGLLESAGRHGGHDRRRRAGCTPATSATPTTTAASSSSTG